MTFWDTIKSGEYLLIFEALLLLACVVILWVRMATMRAQSRRSESMMFQVRDYVIEGDIENALRLCEGQKSPGSEIIHAGLRHLGRPMQEIMSAMAMVCDKEKESLYKGSRWLNAISVIAPLAGLGGTLEGICHQLGELAVTNPQVEISQLVFMTAPALITTIGGLLVGVVAVCAEACLDGRAARAEKELYILSSEFVDLINEPS